MTITTTIGSSGRQQTTPANWLNNVLNGLTFTQIEEGSCYNDSEFTAAGSVCDFNTITTTTTASNYALLDCGAGQSFNANAGVRSNALFYNVSNGVGLRNTGSAGYTISFINILYARANGLQIRDNSGGSGAGHFNNSSGSMLITDCIFVEDGTVNTAVLIQSSNVTFQNCLFVGLNTALDVVEMVGTNTGIEFDFCTFITNAAHYVYNDGTAVYKNCAFFGGGASGFNRTTPVGDTFTTCMTDNPAGTTGLVSGKTFANQFVSTTNDFRVKSGADLINAGSTVSGITTDISLFTRNASTPTIGAWEFGTATTLMGQACL